MSRAHATFVGEVQSVAGAVVRVRLREDLLSALLLVEGQSYRVGQIGAFLRIPLGYVNLFGICSEVGASAAPPNVVITGAEGQGRWLSISLFGEAIGDRFERGISQYPTIGDEVHLITPQDLQVIYGESATSDNLEIGHIASTSGLRAGVSLNKLLNKHGGIFGSTGSGKSNLVTVLLESLSASALPGARVLIIDPHGEYASALGDAASVFRVGLDGSQNNLAIPYWALPFDELRDIAIGPMQPATEAAVRDEVAARKLSAATKLKNPPPPETVTADSPIPFCLRSLWFDLDDYERRTLSDKPLGIPATLIRAGDAMRLTSNVYPDPSPGNHAPHLGPRRGLSKQLDLLRSRIMDGRYRFLFSPGERLSPSSDGSISGDLDELVKSWVGHERPITVLDISGVPSEIRGTIVGTALRIVYDLLFWAGDLSVSGRSQPLLIVLEEAHHYIPHGSSNTAHRAVQRIAKEGRKYGVGLLVVTQRPSEVDQTIMSQLGTFLVLRLSNSGDKSVVSSALPDELSGLTSMLPALRTGETLVVGEGVSIPMRVRIRRARRKPEGSDPNVAQAWSTVPSSVETCYATAVSRWRAQSLHVQDVNEGNQDG